MAPRWQISKKEKYTYHSYKQQGIIRIGFVMLLSILNIKNQIKLKKMFCNKASDSHILVGTVAMTHTRLKSNDCY